MTTDPQINPPVPASAPGTGGCQPAPAGASPLLAIAVHGNPAPQGSKRARPIYKGKGQDRKFTGKVAMVEEAKDNILSWREAVKASALLAMAAWSIRYGGDGPWVRIVGPVAVEIIFCFDKPKSAPKTRRTWPITRSSGDVDKLQRSTFDALTDAGVIKDDSQIVRVVADKVFTDDPACPLPVPGAVIRVWELA